MTREPVAGLLDPRGVAVVGASNDPLKRGHQTIRRLLADGFPHPIYPVNPRECEVLGLPAYRSLTAIEGRVDLAFVATPAAAVPDVMRDCGAKGVGAAVVVAVGFGETGEQGRALEDEIAGIARHGGVALVGPNTNGVFNLPARLNLVGAGDVPAGAVGLVCQSGNVALSLFSQAAHETALGFSSYVGIGNEAGLTFQDVLIHLRDDPDTRAVLVYAEGFRDGRAFLRAARDLSRTKPVVLYKAGRSSAARRAALSHTGAIAGSPRVSAALLRQAGVIVVERADELIPVCEALVGQPPLAGRRVAVLADGGGHATIAADALTDVGLGLAELDEGTRARLRELLPAAASVRNPVDVAGATDRDPELFGACIDALLDAPAVAGVLCVGLFGGYGIRFSDELGGAEERAAVRMAACARDRGKPLVLQSSYFHARPAAHRQLRARGVPVHASVETAARALAGLGERGRAQATVEARSSFAPDSRSRAPQRRHALSEPDGRRLLTARGLPMGDWRLVSDAESAGRAQADLAAPVALKIVSPDVIHKSDADGVRLDVRSARHARRAYQELVAAVAHARPDARITGVLVAPMARPGVELLVGVTTDPSFGPVLTVGAGGTAVEVRDDTTFRALPVTPLECHEMLDELAIRPVLDGFRGAPVVDRQAIVALLLAVSRAVVETPAIVELDLNPVVVRSDGLDVVDVRVVVSAPVGASRPIAGSPPAAKAVVDRSCPDR